DALSAGAQNGIEVGAWWIVGCVLVGVAELSHEAEDRRAFVGEAPHEAFAGAAPERRAERAERRGLPADRAPRLDLEDAKAKAAPRTPGRLGGVPLGRKGRQEAARVARPHAETEVADPL